MAGEKGGNESTECIETNLSSEQSQHKINLSKADVGSSIIIFVISVLAIIGGTQMPVTMTGSKNLWYTAPGSFPIFVGVILAILSLLLFIRSVRKCGAFGKSDLSRIKNVLTTNYFRRLIFSILFLTIYVFIFLGRFDFVLSTAVYLFVNMMVFRSPKYSILKIAFASIIVTAAITYGFGTLAKIPLP